MKREMLPKGTLSKTVVQNPGFKSPNRKVLHSSSDPLRIWTGQRGALFTSVSVIVTTVVVGPAATTATISITTFLVRGIRVASPASVCWWASSRAIVVSSATSAAFVSTTTISVVARRSIAINATGAIVVTVATSSSVATVVSLAIAGAAIASAIVVAAPVPTTTVAVVAIVVSTTTASSASPEVLAFRRTEVFARSGCSWSGSAGLLDAQSPILMDFALKTFLGGISHVRSHHLDEAEASGLPSVRVAHDIALLDVAILLEQTSDLILGKAGMDSGDEEVRAGVARVVVLTLLARLRRWSATVHTVAIVRRGTAGPASIIVATVSAR